MRVWAKTLKDHKIRTQVVQEFSPARPLGLYEWTIIIHELCQTLDLERPVILNKHIQDLNQFGHAFFRQSDFMDLISYDLLEIEVFPEQKKETDFNFFNK